MIAHRLSPFFALALAALTFWLLVSAPGVVEPEFAGTIYGVFALLVAVVFGLIFIGLHFTTAGSITYWSASSPPDQVGRVGVMIGATLAIHLGLSWFLELLGRANETSAIVGLLCWTLVPATFLALGLVRWPVRLTRASRLRLSLASVAAFGFAIGVSYLKFANAPPELRDSNGGRPGPPWPRSACRRGCRGSRLPRFASYCLTGPHPVAVSCRIRVERRVRTGARASRPDPARSAWRLDLVAAFRPSLRSPPASPGIGRLGIRKRLAANRLSRPRGRDPRHHECGASTTIRFLTSPRADELESPVSRNRPV